jgi:hypothetical protein
VSDNVCVQCTVLEKILVAPHVDEQEAVLKTLLQLGANPTRCTADGSKSMIHLSALAVWPAAAALLMAYGADPVLQMATSGATPLHLLARIGAIDQNHTLTAATLLRLEGVGLKRLVRRKPSAVKCSTAGEVRYVDVTDCDGNTVLHDAVVAGNTELVKLLLDAGANIAAQNKCGLRPAQLAQQMLQQAEEKLIFETSQLNKRDPSCLVGSWSNQEVVLWMQVLQLGSFCDIYSRLFATAGIDGQDLIYMDDQMLLQDFQMSTVHRNKVSEMLAQCVAKRQIVQVMRHLNKLCASDEMAKQALEQALERAVVSTIMGQLDQNNKLDEDTKIEKAHTVMKHLGVQ